MSGKTKDPAFPLYCTAWLQSADVRAMTPTQRGVYVDLLCHAWLHPGLPADLELLRRMAGCERAEWRRVWAPPLSDRWVTGRDGLLYNERQEAERAKRGEWVRRVSGLGVAGGLARASRASRIAGRFASRDTSNGPAAHQPNLQPHRQQKHQPALDQQPGSPSPSPSPSPSVQPPAAAAQSSYVPGPQVPGEASSEKPAGPLARRVEARRRRETRA